MVGAGASNDQNRVQKEILGFKGSFTGQRVGVGESNDHGHVQKESVSWTEGIRGIIHKGQAAQLSCPL